MSALPIVLGAAMIALVALDSVLTVLSPSGRGPVTLISTAAVWLLVHGVARRAGMPRLLAVAGPAIVLAVFGSWVLLAWLGFALVYVGGDGRGAGEALYLSGESLTTVGFGDVVAEGGSVRLVTVFEAAAGFGLMTAAITYLLNLYPLVSSIRAGARMLESQAHDAGRAARMVVAGGPSYVQRVQQRLIALDENAERFPLLYYFKPPAADASLYTLMRGAVHVCLQARWGVARESREHARLFGDELETTIDRIVRRYGERFVLGASREDFDRPLEPGDAARRLRVLAAAAGDAGRAPEDLADVELEEFAAFVGRTEAFLHSLADHQLLPRQQLLAS